MKKYPLISVIVPVYNVEQYLRQCLDSILNQTYQEIEVLLINDGSTDASDEICREYAERDSRIRYFVKENGGLSDARNYALDRAEGEYVTFVDSDDFLMEQALEKLYATSLLGESDLVVGFFCYFEEPYFQFFTDHYIPKLPITFIDNIDAVQQLDDMLDVNFLRFSTAWGKLYKRSLFDGIRYPYGKYAEDQFTTWKLYLKAEKIAVSNQTVYVYRYNPKGLSKSFNLSHMDYIDALEERIRETKDIDGIDIVKTYRMYDYVLKRRLSELEFYGYEEEREKLKNKIDHLDLESIINQIELEKQDE